MAIGYDPEMGEAAEGGRVFRWLPLVERLMILVLMAWLYLAVGIVLFRELGG